MKKIKWIQNKEIMMGKIDSYVLFEIITEEMQNNILQYVLYNELPVKEDGIFIFNNKNKDMLIKKAELLYKTFYEIIK